MLPIVEAPAQVGVAVVGDVDPGVAVVEAPAQIGLLEAYALYAHALLVNGRRCV